MLRFLLEFAMIYKNKLPEGYSLVLLGDGYLSILKAVTESIKYPERVTLIGKIPRKSWIYLLSDFKRIVLPSDVDIQESTLMALHDSIDSCSQEIPILVTLNDKYRKIIHFYSDKIEDSFIIADADR